MVERLAHLPLGTVKLITMEMLAHSYRSRNVEQERRQGRYTMDQQEAHARYLHVCARFRVFSLGGRTAAGAGCGAAG